MKQHWKIGIAIALGFVMCVGALPLSESIVGWWNALLLNVGTTIFLAVPIALYLKGIENNVRDLDSDVRNIASSVDQLLTSTGSPSPTEEAQRIVEKFDNDKNYYYEKLESGTLQTDRDISGVLRAAVESGVISRKYGIEIEDPQSNLHFCFSSHTLSYAGGDLDWTSFGHTVQVRSSTETIPKVWENFRLHTDFRAELLAKIKIKYGAMSDFDQVVTRLDETLKTCTQPANELRRRYFRDTKDYR